MFPSLRRRLMVVFTVVIAMFAIVLPTTANAGVAPGDFTLTILHHNDGESQLINAPGQPDYGGVARFKTLADQLKAAADTGPDDGWVMITAGDNFLAGPELSASFESGAPFYDAVALRQVGYDAMVLGNHDFDFNPDLTERFITEVNGAAPPNIPFLSSNLDFSNEPGLQALVTSGLLAKSTVVVEDGRQVGIIGATTENLPFISSPRNVVVSAVAAAVQAEADALTAAGVDIIILSAHLQGLDEDIALIPLLSGIDVAVAGGGDELLSNPGDLLVPGDTADGRPYPVPVADADGNEVPLVTSDGEYKYLGRLVVEFDNAGDLIAIDPGSGPVRVSGVAPDAVAEDATILADVTAPVSAFVSDLAANVIATSEVPLNGRRTPGIRTQETNEGNLVADSFRWQADQLLDDFGITSISAVDVAMANGGGIRNNNVIPAGDITELTTFDILPFSNFLTVFEAVPRTTFKDLLENAYSRVEFVDGRFAHISGAKVVYDPLAAAGSRVVSAELDDGTVIVDNGSVVAGSDISVATVDFLARGGDLYPFGSLPFTVLGVSYQQSLLNYITADTGDGGLGGLISEAQYPVGGEGRIVRDIVTIPEIQGPAHLSPLAGETVQTTGYVTGVAFNGFYFQDPVGDGDDNTSDGIFVFGGLPVAAGDEVVVTGTASEFIAGGAATGNLSTTQLSASDVSPWESGDAPPNPTVIGSSGRIPPNEIVISDSELPTNLQTDPAVFNPAVDGIDFYEAVEGMLVTVENPQLTSATRTFSAFSSEFFTVPNQGADVAPADALNSRGGIDLQPDPDNQGDQNPERVQIQLDGTIYPGTVPDLAVGTVLEDVTGVVGYSFGNFEVNATEEIAVQTPSSLTQETSALAGTDRDLTVASYNVLNLSPDASDDGQRAELASQIVDNLNGPDVIALQEIQDNSGETDDGVVAADQTLQALIDAVVAAGGPAYEFINIDPTNNTQGGVPGGNIRNAFLYNPARVSVVDFDRLEVPPFFPSNDSRIPLVATFEFNGEEITVVNNHLPSRFGSTPIFGGPQPFFQAGEIERAEQTQALNDYVDGLLAADPDANVMVVGDMNTFQWTNEIADILPGPEPVLTNLIDSLTDDAVYTFIFDGNSQVLDHALVTDSLLAGAEFDIVHVNNDFPRTPSNTVGSDHEPLLAKLTLPDTTPLEVTAELDKIYSIFGRIGKFRVGYECTDNIAVASCQGELNGRSVHDGQKVLLIKSSHRGSFYLFGTLVVLGRSFELEVTGIDTSGNTTVATATAL